MTSTIGFVFVFIPQPAGPGPLPRAVFWFIVVFGPDSNVQGCVRLRFANHAPCKHSYLALFNRRKRDLLDSYPFMIVCIVYTCYRRSQVQTGSSTR